MILNFRIDLIQLICDLRWASIYTWELDLDFKESAPTLKLDQWEDALFLRVIDLLTSIIR